MASTSKDKAADASHAVFDAAKNVGCTRGRPAAMVAGSSGPMTES